MKRPLAWAAFFLAAIQGIFRNSRHSLFVHYLTPIRSKRTNRNGRSSVDDILTIRYQKAFVPERDWR
jgi:hypothetical protein